MIKTVDKWQPFDYTLNYRGAKKWMIIEFNKGIAAEKALQ